MERRYIAWESAWAFFTAIAGLPIAFILLVLVHGVWETLSEHRWVFFPVAAIAYAPFVWLAYRIDRALAR